MEVILGRTRESGPMKLDYEAQKDMQKLRKENEDLRNKLKLMSAQNSQLKKICKFFAQENLEIQEKYNKLLENQDQ